MKKSIRLGEMLINKGLISPADLERALKEPRATGEYIGTILVKLGIISEDALIPVLAEQLGIKHANIGDLQIDPDVIKKVPAKFAYHYKMIPMNFEDNILTIGVADPTDIHTLDDIRLLLSYEIEPVLCGEKDLAESQKQLIKFNA